MSAPALVAVQCLDVDQQPRQLRLRRIHVAEAPPVLSPRVFPGAPPLAGNGHLLPVVSLCGAVLEPPVVVRGAAYDCLRCRRLLESSSATPDLGDAITRQAP